MLAIEGAIRDRLATLSELRGVYGVPESDADLSGKPMPGAFVLFNGYKVKETTSRGKAARLASRWVVLIAAKSAANNRDGLPTRSLVAPVVDAVLGSLMGWAPAAEYTPLELIDGPSPRYREGLLVLPLAFTTEHVVKAASLT